MSDTLTKKVLFVCSHSPGKGNLAREALDATFAFAAFEQSVTIYFTGEGVWQLIDAPDANNATTGKSINNSWKAASLYDIEKLTVCEHELASKNITKDQLIEGITVINKGEISAMMTSQDLVLSF